MRSGSFFHRQFSLRSIVANLAVLFLAITASLVTGGTAASALQQGYGSGSAFCASPAPGAYNLGSHFDNVWACGPIPGSGTPDYGDAFESSPWGFQCTELANRFLWEAWGISPIFGAALDGANFAATVHADYPSVPDIANGTPGQPYLPGDIVSFSGSSLEPDGHVAVVIASTEDGSGNGQVTVMEENASSSGQETLTVSNWMLQKAPGSWVTPSDFNVLATGKTTPTQGQWRVLPSHKAGDVLSCLSTTFCQGASQGYEYLLPEKWNGSRWISEARLGLSGSTSPTGISCVSNRYCEMVGVHQDTYLLFAAHWDGRSWSLQSVPSQEYWAFDDVSCASASFCVAVGGRGVAPGASWAQTGSLIERWNGSQWQRMQSPSGISDGLESVSCASPSSCMAIGIKPPNVFTPVPTPVISDYWNGHSWHEQLVAVEPPDSFALGISCPTQYFCVAVGGNQGNHNFILTWSGGRWRHTVIPGSLNLRSVSCVSATFCMAGGSTWIPATNAYPAVAVLWDGSTWTSQILPIPPKGYSAEIGHISCPTSNYCQASENDGSPQGGFVWSR